MFELADDGLSIDEEKTVELVRALAATGNLRPLIGLLRAGEDGPERARDALRVLSEYDVEMLVQVVLDHLINEYVADPGLALQPRRAIRGRADAIDGLPPSAGSDTPRR